MRVPVVGYVCFVFGGWAGGAVLVESVRVIPAANKIVSGANVSVTVSGRRAWIDLCLAAGHRFVERNDAGGAEAECADPEQFQKLAAGDRDDLPSGRPLLIVPRTVRLLLLVSCVRLASQSYPPCVIS